MKIIEPENITLSQLAHYRGQLGLTAKQVADGMKVSLPVVQHIENGEFEKIGAAPFIRGQVINYCKFLKLDATEVLSQISGSLLVHQNAQRPDAFLPTSVSKVRLKTNHYGRYAFGTTLLAVLTVSAYFVWDKWGLMSGADSSIQLLNSNKETVTYSSILPPVHEVGTENQISVESNDTDQAGDSEAIETEDVLSQGDSVDIEETAVELEAASDNEQQEQAVAVEASEFVIEFDLQEAAWVSIKTEAGTNVVHDLIGPGIRKYESNQPMSLRIGNAEKLTLKINGEAVDVARYSDKNLAKFNWPLGS